MNISEHVIANWDALPKSNFNDSEVVVVKEVTNEDYGWGHHSYEGYAVDRDGNLFWCYSSGCSCNGDCGADHTKDAKVFETEWPDEFASIKPEDVNFGAMEVHFSDY